MPDKKGNLIEHIFNTGICVKHLPKNLISTKGKIIINECDPKIVEFLQNPTNFPIFEFLKQIEQIANMLPSFYTHVLVLHKIFYTSGLFIDSFVLNTKIEYVNQFGFKDTVQLAYDIGNSSSLDLSVQKYLEDCDFNVKTVLTRLSSYENKGVYFNRPRCNSI